MQRLIDTDPIVRRKHVFHADGDNFFIETVQDVEPNLERSKGQYNEFSHKSAQRFKGDLLHKVAEIPITVWEDLKRSGIADDEKALAKWLDDRDNSVFRTMPGRLSK
jgi:hypothetical protein